MNGLNKKISINSSLDPQYQCGQIRTTDLSYLHIAHCYKYFQKKNYFYSLRSLGYYLNYIAHLSFIFALLIFQLGFYFYFAITQEEFAIILTDILNFLEEAFFKHQFNFVYFRIYAVPKSIYFEYYYFYLMNFIKYCFT